MLTINPFAQPVKQTIAKAVKLSASHLNKTLAPAEPDIQGARVTGIGVSGCNRTGLKRDLKKCQPHSQQAG